MHQNSYDIMSGFVKKYVEPLLAKNERINVLDVGSCCVQENQPTYKTLFKNPLFNYVGLDLCWGNNVTVVTQDPYKWPLKDETFEVVISGQCLEHTEAPWVWIKEIERVCKPEGHVAVIAPWIWGQHRYPLDCWRILPDGMSYLLSKWCKFELLDVGSHPPEIAGDCWGFAHKPKAQPKKEFTLNYEEEIKRLRFENEMLQKAAGMGPPGGQMGCPTTNLEIGGINKDGTAWLR